MKGLSSVEIMSENEFMLLKFDELTVIEFICADISQANGDVVQ